MTLSMQNISHELIIKSSQTLASSEYENWRIWQEGHMSLANRLRTLREHATLSQADVAAALDVSIPTVSEWEKGKKKPARARIPALARLYDVSTDFLLNGIDLRRSDMNETEEEKSLILLYREADPQVKISVLTLLRAASDKR
ncbi:helix-turn-helix domain-containing protein [Gluconobacter japonicus]|uniref:helix-turn-helix domain-containing protein n=1 Tax=Gluconobacter japonicus TaxID=376620 RepID=UPI0039ED5AB2